MLSRFPFPLEKGDKLRAYHQLKGLSQEYKIVLICTVEQAIKEEDYQQVARFCDQIHLFKLTKAGLFFQLFISLLSGKPFQVVYFYRSKYKRAIHRILEQEKPQHIYCQLVRVSEYVKDYHFCHKTLDYMDALSKGMERRIDTEPFFKRWFFRTESRRLVRYERRMFDYFEHKTIISEQDRKLILHPQNKEIRIVPNGVDVSFFQNLQIQKDVDLVFTGNFSYAPNIEAAVYLAKEVVPALLKRGMKVKLLLSGANPVKRVSDLANEQVEVSGWVTDIRVSYQRSRIFVAPLFIGTGLQNKLLEAMASDLPCITTPLANNALKGEHAKNILLADNLTDFVENIEKIITDKINFAEIASKGKQFVEENYSWNYQNFLLLNILRT